MTDGSPIARAPRCCLRGRTMVFEHPSSRGSLYSLVKSLRLPSPARVLTVALLMISWFIATNHCAIGLMKRTGQAEAEHSHCHPATTPAKDAPAEGVLQCCKGIHGTLAPAKAKVKFDESKFQLQLFALVQMLAPVSAEQEHSPFIFDHGPPRAVSFAECVLQRSLLGHAPPLAV